MKEYQDGDRRFEHEDDEYLVEQREECLNELERVLSDIDRELLQRLMEIERELTLREE